MAGVVGVDPVDFDDVSVSSTGAESECFVLSWFQVYVVISR
jgi:hypothetical protein